MMATSLRNRQPYKALTAKKGWSDWQKWWMDLTKSSITFVVAAAVSYYVIDELQQRRAEARAQVKAKEDALLTVKLKALEEFRVTILSGYDDLIRAIAQLERAPEKGDQELDLDKVLAAQSRLVASINGMTILFPNQKAQMEKVEESYDLARAQLLALIDVKKGRPALFRPADLVMALSLSKSYADGVLKNLQAELLGLGGTTASPAASAAASRP